MEVRGPYLLASRNTVTDSRPPKAQGWLNDETGKNKIIFARQIHVDLRISGVYKYGQRESQFNVHLRQLNPELKIRYDDQSSSFPSYGLLCGII
jgi:hypothetical protein